jgi:hypothetical protein
MKRARAAVSASFFDPGPAPAVRSCDHPGCGAAGDFRAPRARDALDDYYWFCLDHVRVYNAQWNYYAGMSQAQIEAEIRNDTVWQRPSWPMGSRIGGWRWSARFSDYGLFDDEDEAEARRAAPRRPRTAEEEALIVFELQAPFTLMSLKARYKELVKLHHPDVHGGDKAAEERLKVINQAYTTLKASYFP